MPCSPGLCPISPGSGQPCRGDMAQPGGNLLAWMLVGGPWLLVVEEVAWEPSALQGHGRTGHGTGAL